MEVEAPPASDIAPSQTLYLNRLNEKVKKAAMKKALYGAFSQYGRIADLIVCKTKSLRGQAWVVFTDVAAATTALRSMQGFTLYEQPMQIHYAKTKSHAIEKLEGSYRVRPKRAREVEQPEEKGASGGGAKRARGPEGLPVVAAPPAPPPPAAALPSHKLLVQNLPALPEETLLSMVRELFGKYAGLVDVRVVAPRRLAFVEYSSDTASTPALQGLHNFAYDGAHTIAVTYAK